MGLDAVQLELKISAEKILPVRLLLCRLLLGNMCVNAGLHSAPAATVRLTFCCSKVN